MKPIKSGILYKNLRPQSHQTVSHSCDQKKKKNMKKDGIFPHLHEGRCKSTRHFIKRAAGHLTKAASGKPRAWRNCADSKNTREILLFMGKKCICVCHLPRIFACVAVTRQGTSVLTDGGDVSTNSGVTSSSQESFTRKHLSYFNISPYQKASPNVNNRTQRSAGIKIAFFCKVSYIKIFC